MNNQILMSLINHNKIKPEHHDVLLNHPNSETKQNAISNLKMSDDNFDKIYHNNKDFGYKAILLNPHLPEHLINHAVENIGTHYSIFGNNSLKPHHLVKILHDSDALNYSGRLLSALSHPNADKSVLDKAIRNPNIDFSGTFGHELLSNKHHTKEHLDHIMKNCDLSASCAQEALNSPHLNKEHLEILANHGRGYSDTAMKAKQKLKERYQNE